MALFFSNFSFSFICIINLKIYRNVISKLNKNSSQPRGLFSVRFHNEVSLWVTRVLSEPVHADAGDWTLVAVYMLHFLSDINFVIRLFEFPNYSKCMEMLDDIYVFMCLHEFNRITYLLHSSGPWNKNMSGRIRSASFSSFSSRPMK